MFYGWSNKYINMVLRNRENRNSDISHDVWGLCTDSFPAIDLRRIHGCFVTAYSFIVTQKPDQQGFHLTTKEAWSPFYAPWTVTNIRIYIKDDSHYCDLMMSVSTKKSLGCVLLSEPFLFSAHDVWLYNPNKLKVMFTERMEQYVEKVCLTLGQ